MSRTHLLLGLTVALFSCARGEEAHPRDEVAPSDTAAGGSSVQVISATGYGPLRAGMSATDAATATQGALRVSATTSSESCEYAEWAQAPRGLAVMFEGGALVRIDVREAGIATSEGLEVGASAARARSLYPSARRMPHKYEAGEYLIVRPLAPGDTVHRLVIEVVGGRVTQLRGGRFPAVEYVEGCA